MRRLALALVAPLAVTAAVAGCSSPASNANDSVVVSGAVGKAPTVRIPARPASGNLVVRTVDPGHGPVLTVKDDYVANFAVYVWHGATHRLLYSTYSTTPQGLPVQIGLTGLQKAMAGQRVGSRVLAVLPPRYGYGAAGNSQIGVGASDTLVWVIDPIAAYPVTASAAGAHVSDGGGALPTVTAKPGGPPSITVPKGAPPRKLTVVTLIKGTGPAVRAGQDVVVRYVGAIWRTGKVFDENWPSAVQPSAPPTVFQLGHVIAGWNAGLPGVPVGSRVMLVVPPAEGYGKAGQPQAGITGSDTLVFVVDVLGTAA